MMEKYGTYGLFVNTETGEENRVLIDDGEYEKLASSKEWKELKDESEVPKKESRGV